LPAVNLEIYGSADIVGPLVVYVHNTINLLGLFALFDILALTMDQ
jgi:hypothetical protein